jgi:predicted helicase
MQRAVAFCQVIEVATGAKTHKVSSKNIAGMFKAVVNAYQEAENVDPAARLTCDAEHVDGGMNASAKEKKLEWLKDEVPEGTCRVLSNVRCLSEGVDVPALDAVLFLTPRNSQVDVVQSVGRVMRNAEGKKRGYVILPVVIPAGVEAHDALNDHKTYAVVWQVLQALRSHDDRFDAMVNKLDLIGQDTKKMEVIAITDKVQRKPLHSEVSKSKRASGRGQYGLSGTAETTPSATPEQATLAFEIGEIEKGIYAKIVQKCGNRHHWEDWANDIAKIARTHIDRIHAIIEDPTHTKEREAFEAFANELRDDLNDSISDDEIIEMLAQHLITKPVFDALFADFSFAQHNPMSQAMQAVLDALEEHRLDKEVDTLERFYESVRERAEGIDGAAGKQKIVVELYDKFFRNAFPKMTERLGIVYTPVEVVDFIIHSVAYLLEKEFGQSLGSKGVHILDPFTGTGTFITRLLQSGLISPEQLPYKYKNEIHANELVLLAYYIAAINIEAVYHSLVGGKYQPFEGICLTDTFQMYEKDDLVDALLVDNSARRKRQKKLDIRVIVGNPPYSVGQVSASDNNQNVAYPHLDSRIRDTYAARTKMTNKRALYDSYIRAIRWASDRIGNAGIIAFVSNGGWVDGNITDGLRLCLAEEFSSIHVFHLRGNARTSGEQRRKEKDNVFGMGSRAPIAISLLVKNPNASAYGRILFHDIGDYLTREEKLGKVAAFASIRGITEANAWQEISPDDSGNWIKQGEMGFQEFLALAVKDGSQDSIFKIYSSGMKTNRDAWSFNSSRDKLSKTIEQSIRYFNALASSYTPSSDESSFKWCQKTLGDLAAGKKYEFDEGKLRVAHYRPFNKQWLYMDGRLNWSKYLTDRYFPDQTTSNRVISLSAPGFRGGFSALMSDVLPSIHFADMAGAQCFPLEVYESHAPTSDSLNFGGVDRGDGVSDKGLSHFQAFYPGETLTKEDVFYYIYGLLHCDNYREHYADNLSKELPRIPCVKTAADFWAFSKAGRGLAELHLNYEAVVPFAAKIDTGGKSLTDADYRVEKMKIPKNGKEKDLTTLVYNTKITVTGIPPEAYDYVVNGKPALDWVIERQCVKKDKDSGIVNDANDWAIETMKNPRYPLDLFLRVITVSLETMKIVRALPKLDI